MDEPAEAFEGAIHELPLQALMHGWCASYTSCYRGEEIFACHYCKEKSCDGKIPHEVYTEQSEWLEITRRLLGFVF
jgi:hypothetical protein